MKRSKKRESPKLRLGTHSSKLRNTEFRFRFCCYSLFRADMRTKAKDAEETADDGD